MKLAVAAIAAATVAFAAPASASAATLVVDNEKPCFGTGDTVRFSGTGYTAGGIVAFTRDGVGVPADPPITAGADGTMNARLRVVADRPGQQLRTYAATDQTNPANTASVPVNVSELNVAMRPRRGRPNRPRRISAVGFTGGRTLWAHIVFRGNVRTLKVGALKGPCRSLTARKRLFSARPRFGRHVIHFDTSRRYRRRVPQRISFSFRIFRVFRGSAATASAPVRR
jgi:hypothetical protein